MLRNAVINSFDIDIFMAVNANLVIKWLSYNIIMPVYQCWLLSSSGPKISFCVKFVEVNMNCCILFYGKVLTCCFTYRDQPRH